MRLSKRKRSNRPVMDMTPMIDIVFLLIIFFMTVTQVSEVNKEQMKLPELEGSIDQKPTMLTINVMDDGELRVSVEAVTIARVVALVEQELFRLGGNVNLLTVVVRADENGLSRATNEVVRALGRMGVVRIRIAVQATQ